MKEVEYLEDLKEGDFVYLITKNGNKELVFRLDMEEPELKGRYAISQYPISGNLRYISDKDWDEKYLRKYRISGGSSWCKEFEEI
jgi:hypothetical protein